MNNETTAGQPKSIGDDAQFIDWLKAWSHEYENRLRDSDVDDITKQVAAYIDSRAPAAQALATIQAAPDDGPIPCPFCGSVAKLCGAYNAWSVNCTECNAYGPSTDKAGALDGWNKRYIAATIHEPLMVTEPVGKRVTLEELHAVICEDGKVGNYLALSIAEKVMKMLPAAPMVADPAGVEWWRVRYLCKAILADCVVDTAKVDAQRVLDFIESGAATVKAVPSEAPAPLKHIPTNDLVYAEVRKSVVNSSFYVSSNAVNDVMAAVRRLVIAKERS